MTTDKKKFDMSKPSGMLAYIRSLTDNDSLYVLNVSNKRSPDGKYSKLAMDYRQDGESLPLIVEATGAPVDLTGTCPVSLIKVSRSFRSMLDNGYLIVIDSDEASDVLSTPEARAEMARLAKAKADRGANGLGPSVEAKEGRYGEAAVASTPTADTLVSASPASDDIFLPIIKRAKLGKLSKANMLNMLSGLADETSISDIAATIAVLGDTGLDGDARSVLIAAMAAKAAPAAKPKLPAGLKAGRKV